MAPFFIAFPDLGVTIEDMIAEDDKVVSPFTVHATDEGELFGIPGTSQPIEFMAIDIHGLEGGQIVETWHIEDFLSVLFQIGASIQPGSTAATPTA